MFSMINEEADAIAEKEEAVSMVSTNYDQAVLRIWSTATFAVQSFFFHRMVAS